MAKKLALVNGVPRMVDESSSPTIYDETMVIASTITTGTEVVLPNSGTYDSRELEIYFNGVRIGQPGEYEYVGTVPRTRIIFTFDLVPTDVVRFRIDRGA